MYQRMVLIVSLLLLLLIGGCVERQEFQSASKQRSKADSSSVDQQVTELTAKLDRLQREIRGLRDTVKIVRVLADSLVQLYEASEAENVKLKAQLAQAREVIPTMREQYEYLFLLQQMAHEELEDELEVTETNLQVTEQECTSLQEQREELQQRLNQLEPWAAKWRVDAHRGFIKVMFGAGKASVPDFPEPQLE